MQQGPGDPFPPCGPDSGSKDSTRAGDGDSRHFDYELLQAAVTFKGRELRPVKDRAARGQFCQGFGEVD